MRPCSVCTVFLVVFAAVAPPGAALHCNGVIIQVDAGSETIYVDDRSSGALYLDRWIYLETNGVDGLQSGGDIGLLDDQPYTITDPCVHYNPDALLLLV